MALLTSFDTEKTVMRQTAWSYDATNGWGVVSRTKTVTSTRYVYDSLAAAETAAASMSGSVVCRRINDHGWAEIVQTTTTYSSWSSPT